MRIFYIHVYLYFRARLNKYLLSNNYCFLRTGQFVTTASRMIYCSLWSSKPTFLNINEIMSFLINGKTDLLALLSFRIATKLGQKSSLISGGIVK